MLAVPARALARRPQAAVPPCYPPIASSLCYIATRCKVVARAQVAQVDACAAPAPAANSASASPAASARSSRPIAQIFPNGEFSVDMQVRDSELDQYRVVNNAVYNSYFQHARHEALVELGHDADEYAARGSPLALSQINIAYRAPLRSRDRFRVTVSVLKVTPARVVFKQRVVRTARGGAPQDPQAPEKEEVAAEAEATVVFLDASYRPARVPKDVSWLFQELAELLPKQ